MILTLIAIGFLVLLHEFGHYFAGRVCGVGVNEFSIGFGREIISRPFSGTRFCLRIIPFGGYVSFKTDENGAGEGASLSSISPCRRIFIFSAGPLANIAAAYLLFFFVALLGVPHHSTKIGGILSSSPAAAAGLLSGDRVMSINGIPVANWEGMTGKINEGAGRVMNLLVQRNGSPITIPVAPKISDGRWRLGLGASGELVYERHGFFASFADSASMVWAEIADIAVTLRHLATGSVSVNALCGPIAIAKLGGDTVHFGFRAFALFIGVLSVNLFILNLLPIAPLDGAGIIFSSCEAVVKRPVNECFRKGLSYAGMALMMSLFVMVFFNDLLHLIRP